MVSELDEKLTRFEERRDKNLTEKLDTLEKLFNIIIDTKISSISELIYNLQTEQSDQYKECKLKLEQYQEKLVSLKTSQEELRYILEGVGRNITYIQNTHKDIEKRIMTDTTKELTLTEWRTRADFLLSSMKAQLSVSVEKLEKLEKWKDTFWWRYIASGIVIIITATELLEKIFKWLKSALLLE